MHHFYQIMRKKTILNYYKMYALINLSCIISTINVMTENLLRHLGDIDLDVLFYLIHNVYSETY